MNYLNKLYQNKASDLYQKLNFLKEEYLRLDEAMTEEERLEKQSSEISKRLAAISQKDPSQLTSFEASQLMMDKIMMQGGPTAKATKGLSDKVEQKLKTLVLDKEVDPTINQQQRDIENIERIPGIIASTVGRDFEDLRQATQTAMARERRPKEKPQSKDSDASSQQMEAQPYESLKGVSGVDISADTPDWVIRWAKKWGEDPRKIEAMRLGVQSALGGDPTRPMNPNLTASEVARLGVKLNRDRTNYKTREKSKQENKLSGFEGLGAPERPKSTPAPKPAPAPEPTPVPEPAPEYFDPAPLPKTIEELNAERRAFRAIGANVGYNLNRILGKTIEDQIVKNWDKAQDREKTRDIYSTQEDAPEESLQDILDKAIEQAKKQGTSIPSDSLSDTLNKIIQTAKNNEEEYPIVPASPEEGKFEQIPEPSVPRIVKYSYSRPFDDYVPKLRRDIPKTVRPSPAKQPTAITPWWEDKIQDSQGMNIPMSLPDESGTINSGGMNTPMSLPDEIEPEPKPRKLREILDRLSLDGISPGELLKVLDKNPQLRKLLQQSIKN